MLKSLSDNPCCYHSEYSVMFLFLTGFLTVVIRNNIKAYISKFPLSVVRSMSQVQLQTLSAEYFIRHVPHDITFIFFLY